MKNTRIEFILALEKEEKRKALEENNIVVKNNAFTLTEAQKSIIEKKYNYTFSKKYFSTKNTFLYDIVRKTLEENGFTFLSEKEIKEKVEEEIKALKEKLEKVEEEKKSKEEEKKEEEEKKKN